MKLAKEFIHKTDDLISVMDEEIEKIRQEGVTEAELKSAKTRLKVSQIRQMGSNQGLMMGMLSAEFKQGSWEKVFEDLNAIDKITTKDIQNLVKDYLTRSNRSVGRIEKKEQKKEEVKK